MKSQEHSTESQSPANTTLFPEILQAVFLWAQILEPNPWKQLLDQYAFVRVCRSWLDVAQSASELWANIIIVSEKAKKPNGILHPLRRLELSKNRPLHVCAVDCLADYDRDMHDKMGLPFISSEDGLKKLYEFIIPYLHKVEVFEVHLRRASSVRAMFPLPGALPLLKELRVYTKGDSTRLCLSTCRLATIECTSPLEVLHVRSNRIDNLVLAHVPSDFLQDVTLYSRQPSRQEVMEWIGQASHIQELYLDNVRPWRDDMQTLEFRDRIPCLDLPTLWKLTASVHLLKFVAEWNTPHLKSVTLVGLKDVWETDVGVFGGVADLTLETCFTSIPHTLARVLSSFPNLRMITLSPTCHMFGILLEALKTRHSSLNSFPTDDAVSDVDREEFGRLQHRSPFVAPGLATVVVTLDDNNHQHFLEETLLLRWEKQREGIRFNFTGSRKLE